MADSANSTIAPVAHTSNPPHEINRLAIDIQIKADKIKDLAGTAYDLLDISDFVHEHHRTVVARSATLADVAEDLARQISDAAEKIDVASMALRDTPKPDDTSPTSDAVPDAQIIAAWDRKVEAYRAYNGSPMHDQGAEDTFWPTIDHCDRIIHAANAETPLGVELQIWTALKNSSAYTSEEEAALLSRDIHYVEQHKQAFDWDAQAMIAAIRSLRAMGSH